jgi:hypothetical protein
MIIILATLVAVAGLQAADPKEQPAKRYNIEANLEQYPQDGPKVTLNSVIKAIESKKFDYLLAHLADPKFVDQRVRYYDGRFEDLVQESTSHLDNNPTILKTLKRMAGEGEWETGDAAASVSLKGNTDKVFLKKIGNRWYFENRQTEKAKP